MIFAIGAALLGAMTVSAAIYPGTALAALVCVFGLEQWFQAQDSYFATHAAVTNYASAVVVLVGFVSSIAQGSKPWRRVSLLEWTILSLYGLFVLSGIWAIGPTWWWSIVRHGAPYAVVYLLILPRIYQDSRDFRHAAVAIMLFGGMSVTLLLFGTSIKEWGRHIETKTEVVNRYGETLKKGSPHAVASLGCDVAIFATLVAWPGIGMAFYTVRFFLVAGGIALVFRAESRGQLLAIVGSLGAFLPLRWPKLRIGAVFGILATAAIFAGIIAWGVNYSIMANRFDLSNFLDVYNRTRWTPRCLPVLRELFTSPQYLFLGMGGGSTYHLLDGTFPHLLGIELLCELGVVGLSIFVAVVCQTGWTIIKLLRLTETDIYSRSLAAAFSAACLFEFIITFKGGTFHHGYFLFIWCILVARFESSLRLEQTQEAKRKAAQKRRMRQQMLASGEWQPVPV